MVTFAGTMIALWLPAIFAFPTSFSSALINYDDEYEYNYGGDTDFFDNDDNEFSGEVGSGEMASFSREKDKSKRLLNIDEAEEISDQDKNYRSYLDIIQRLNKTINYTADPCSDFFEYACGNSKRDADVFDEIKQQNDWKIINAIETFKLQEHKDSFVNKAKRYYESCTISYSNSCGNSTSVAIFRKILQKFSIITGLEFPASGNSNTSLNATILARAIAVLNGFHVDTFLTPSVVHHNTGYTFFFVDQSSLYYPIGNYNKTGEHEMEAYKTTILKTLREYFRLMNIIVKNSEILKIANEIVAMEITIAREYSTNERLDDECYSGNGCYINNFSNYAFIDLEEYFRILSAQNKFIRHYFASNNHPVLARKYIMQKLDKNFAKVFKPEVVINYMFYRLIMSRRSYIMSENGQCQMAEILNSEANNKPRYTYIENDSDSIKNDNLSRFESSNDYEQIMIGKWKCLQRIKSDIPEIADRFDIVTISNKQRFYLDRYLNNLLKNVKFSLINMLRLTFAVDDESFNILKDELSKVGIVVRYPTNTNDDTLDFRYKELSIDESDGFYEMREKLLNYSFRFRYESLGSQTANGRIYTSLMSADDILYDYMERKIVIAFTLLKRPFFDVDWPESVVYATLGFVFGHELIHSIADVQLRYPWIGKLNAKTLSKKQNDMEDCLIQQYKNYCPLSNTNLLPKCVDGFSSYAENMADNGGITAAYLAYQTRAALYGRDPQLPHPLFSKFTHEQLFFMGFAQTFCHRPLTNDEWRTTLLTTPTYSPQKYRVVGTLANFAAFKNAFNCPVTPDEEAERCYTWIPKLDDSLI